MITLDGTLFVDGKPVGKVSGMVTEVNRNTRGVTMTVTGRVGVDFTETEFPFESVFLEEVPGEEGTKEK